MHALCRHCGFQGTESEGKQKVVFTVFSSLLSITSLSNCSSLIPYVVVKNKLYLIILGLKKEKKHITHLAIHFKSWSTPRLLTVLHDHRKSFLIWAGYALNEEIPLIDAGLHNPLSTCANTATGSLTYFLLQFFAAWAAAASLAASLTSLFSAW